MQNRMQIVMRWFLIILCITLAHTPVRAQEEDKDEQTVTPLPLGFKNEPDAFHGIRWGTYINQLDFLRKVPANEWLLKNNEYDQEEDSYIRKDARIVLKESIHFLEKIGDLDVRVEYIFYKHRFYKIILSPQKKGFKNIDEARKIILMAMELKYGEPHSGTGAGNIGTNSIWYGKKVDILYDHERGLYAYIYKPIEEQIVKDREKSNRSRVEENSTSEHKAAEKAAKDL